MLPDIKATHYFYCFKCGASQEIDGYYNIDKKGNMICNKCAGFIKLHPSSFSSKNNQYTLTGVLIILTLASFVIGVIFGMHWGVEFTC